MEIKDIRRLVDLMVKNDLSELDITEGDNQVHLKRGTAAPNVVHTAVPAAAAQVQPQAPAPAEGAPAPEANAPADNLVEVRSPMVGTFYSSPSPDSDPFASPGDKVGPDTVVCIIEAMKVMNEIKAECAGTIEEVCVQNAHPVEFGQVMFRVKPA